MEFVSPAKFTVVEKRGLTERIQGVIHRLDQITKMIYLELDKEKRIHNENKNLRIL